jgi:hypothetical protein
MKIILNKIYLYIIIIKIFLLKKCIYIKNIFQTTDIIPLLFFIKQQFSINICKSLI